jgi:hypothetical protein
MVDRSTESKAPAKRDESRVERDARKEAFDREVEDELRREQIEKIWKSYGTYILGAAAMIVVGVGGWKLWEGRQIAAANAAGGRFAAAAALAEQAKADDALKAFHEIAKNGPSGYATLAQLRLAGAHAKAGRTAEAIAAFETVTRLGDADPLLADYARLQIASLKLDSSDWTDLQNRLTPLAADKAPWRYSARELLGLAAWKAGKIEEARTSFEQLLADRRVPPSIGERARIVMDAIVASELAKGVAIRAEPVKADPAKTEAPAAQPPAAEQKKKK